MSSPSLRLLEDGFRLPLERAVAAHLGREWRVQTFSDLIDLASHGSAILSDGRYAVFAKLSEAANARDQIEAEIAGLRYLSAHSGVRAPTPLTTVEAPGGVILVLEAVQAVERGPREWRQIGQALAQIHQARGKSFGFERQGYFGPFYQDNRPLDDWLTFFAERRLWPRLAGAINAGRLPSEVVRQVERLIGRLPALDLPPCPPTLLHGDAQQNNFISTAAGALVIDPAVYYGHPEIDLAHIDYFQPVPQDVFDGYREVLPIEPGFAARRDLWRIPAYLGIVELEGGSYLEPLERALRQYL